MSIFLGAAPLQLLKKGAKALGGDCLLCGAGADGLVCAGCAASPVPGAPACPRCALPMPRAETCGRCLRRPPSVDCALAAFQYRFPIDRLVLRFKFAGDLAAGRWLAECLAAAVREAPTPDLVVVPPIAAARLRERGFNQALEIAKVVCAARGVTLDRDAVTRVRDAPAQSTLDARERRANLRGAFECRSALAGRHVAIVDDVMTTGATLDSMAHALRASGAGRIDAWVVARTPEPCD